MGALHSMTAESRLGEQSRRLARLTAVSPNAGSMSSRRASPGCGGLCIGSMSKALEGSRCYGYGQEYKSMLLQSKVPVHAGAGDVRKISLIINRLERIRGFCLRCRTPMISGAAGQLVGCKVSQCFGVY